MPVGLYDAILFAYFACSVVLNVIVYVKQVSQC